MSFVNPYNAYYGAYQNYGCVPPMQNTIQPFYSAQQQTAMPQQTTAPQQPVAQPQAPQQQQPENPSIVWVQGEAGAKAYIVAPGNTVPLWDSENPIIYLKSVDAAGMPSMKIFEYKERNAQANTDKIDVSVFVTRNELDQILSERLNQLQSSVKTKESGKNE